MRLPPTPTLRAISLLCGLGLITSARAQPADAPALALADIRPGQHGEVWTVFRGTQAESFTVEVTGVVHNAIGPGKSLILCELTDPRVQNMGAVAGMSGSPLYIDGKFAGALSYQVQRFETVRYAGFTPAADLAEVRGKVGGQTIITAATSPDLAALRPVFTVSGLSPAVAELFAPRFAALGLTATALGGSSTASSLHAPPSTLHSSSPALRAGSAVSVALTTGDITIAATGTVSHVDGAHITAFGHPLLTLGEVELPMCAAEIVTILPSTMQSVKIANTGAIIGTISQDRLSAVSGTLGAGPEMTAVEVSIGAPAAAKRAVRFNVIRHPQLTAQFVAAGVAQAIMGSNDAGLTHGFLLHSDIIFPAGQSLASRALYAGPSGFQQGLGEFLRELAQNLQNPWEKTFPRRVAFTVEPLAENPAVTLELFTLSRTSARAGETVQATLAWRDFQGSAHREIVDIPTATAWAGKTLEVVLAPGAALDELAGRPRLIRTETIRSFDAYLAALRDDRASDGLHLAVVEKTRLFTDQAAGTPELPGTFERIARTADEARFQSRGATLPLWEKHLLPGKLASVVLRRSLTLTD